MSETEIKSFTVPDIPEGRDYIALSFALGFFALVFLHEGPHHVELICDGTPRQSVRFRVDRKPTNVAPNQGEHTTRGV